MAGAVLAGVGLAAIPSVAHALPSAVTVPCNAPALIAAIKVANTARSETLNLASNCTYNLIAPYVQPTTRGDSGLPIITGNISLVGGPNTVIRRDAAAKFRILEVSAGAILNLRKIEITNGDAFNATTGNRETGGGILNARGRVTLFHTLVHNNTAANGAGISNNSGVLRLVSSTVRNNTTGNSGGGGGIYTDGFLSVRFSRVNSNRANTHGGGIFNELGGRAFIYRSDVVGNIAVTHGGGIHNAPGGTLQGDLVRVSYNAATNGGDGGVYNSARLGAVTFTRSAIVANYPNNCHPVNTVPGCTG